MSIGRNLRMLKFLDIGLLNTHGGWLVFRHFITAYVIVYIVNAVLPGSRQIFLILALTLGKYSASRLML
jgi:hypothetical protein